VVVEMTELAIKMVEVEVEVTPKIEKLEHAIIVRNRVTLKNTV
jgi:hypothetical protein